MYEETQCDGLASGLQEELAKARNETHRSLVKLNDTNEELETFRQSLGTCDNEAFEYPLYLEILATGAEYFREIDENIARLNDLIENLHGDVAQKWHHEVDHINETRDKVFKRWISYQPTSEYHTGPRGSRFRRSSSVESGCSLDVSQLSVNYESLWEKNLKWNHQKKRTGESGPQYSVYSRGASSVIPDDEQRGSYEAVDVVRRDESRHSFGNSQFPTLVRVLPTTAELEEDEVAYGTYASQSPLYQPQTLVASDNGDRRIEKLVIVMVTLVAVVLVGLVIFYCVRIIMSNNNS